MSWELVSWEPVYFQKNSSRNAQQHRKNQIYTAIPETPITPNSSTTITTTRLTLKLPRRPKTRHKRNMSAADQKETPEEKINCTNANAQHKKNQTCTARPEPPIHIIKYPIVYSILCWGATINENGVSKNCVPPFYRLHLH